MARRGNPLTQEVAAKALKKLEAADVSEPGGAHPLFAIIHDGKIVATTGLRHSSKKDLPVPHVKNDLGVNLSFILGLAHCSKYRDDWLKKRGFVADDVDDDATE